MATSEQLEKVMGIPDPYKTLEVPREAKIDEIRRSYKQKVLETHPDKLPLTASEEEKRSAQDLFHQIQEAFRILNNPQLRRVYDVHIRPLPEQTPIRIDPGVSALSRAPTRAPTLTSSPKRVQTSTQPYTNKPIPSLAERPRSDAVVVLRRLGEAHERQMKERSEWAKKSEERRLDKLRAHNVSEEIQSLGQKQATLVEKMIQDLFALTPEWEMRRMKARAYKASRTSTRAH